MYDERLKNGHTLKLRKSVFYNDLQLKSDETAQLLNKPYVTEGTLRGQKQPLKCC